MQNWTLPAWLPADAILPLAILVAALLIALVLLLRRPAPDPLAGMVMGQTYYGNFPDQMEAKERAYVEEFLYDHFRFIRPVQSEPFTVQYVLSLARSMGADGVIVDPFGSLALPSKGNSNEIGRAHV